MGNSFNDELGKYYNEFYNVVKHIPAMQRKVGRLVARHFSDNSGLVLDIGTGTGDTIAATRAVCPNARFIGVDVEEQMIAQSQERFENDPSINLVLADALDMLHGVEDDSVDAITSGFCLHNLSTEPRENIIAELGRVLKHGGLFATCDKIALDNMEDHIQSFTKQVLQFDGFMYNPTYRAKWIAHYIFDDQSERRIAETQWRTTLKHSGFKRVRILSRTMMDCVSYAKKP